MADSKNVLNALNPLADFPQYEPNDQKVYLENLLSQDQKAVSALLATRNAEVLRAFIDLSFRNPDKFALCPQEELVNAFKGNAKSFFIAEVATEADGKKAAEEAGKRGFAAYTVVRMDQKQFRIYDIEYNTALCAVEPPRVLPQQNSEPPAEDEKAEKAKTATV